MKKSVFPLVLVFCLFVTFFSCSNKPKRSRKPVSTIVIQPTKLNYFFGEKVSVDVKTILENGKIENIQLYYKNQLLKESSDLEFTVSGVELNTLGNSSFKVIATKTDGVENNRSKVVSVLYSDIIPKKYTYQIINTYPHLTTSFTEGLEYYNGFLYEGTGNHGESDLLKINLTTGEAVNTIHLDSIYFGEGITILNDKIYQLTYRAQKGFIYNLSDFALIDSFLYKSAEGWGLTNDGTNLIMSNGTETLTWINPNDFSVVKTLQVANNNGLRTLINELEYIDGKILANIYTTNIIVEIDAETGRVLSEVNLDNLMNSFIMNNNIDYMNGIAYDKENDRLFVTGKWWPNLFEIKLTESE